VLRDFLQRLPLVELAPDTQTVKHAGGARVRVVSKPGSQYAMYLDGNGPVDVVLDLPPGDYFGEWIDTATGEIARNERFRHQAGERALRSPEFRNGVVLHLKRTGQ
jgi:hypothetical protein